MAYALISKGLAYIITIYTITTLSMSLYIWRFNTNYDVSPFHGKNKIGTIQGRVVRY